MRNKARKRPSSAPPVDAVGRLIYVYREKKRSVYHLFGVKWWEIARALKYDFHLCLIAPESTSESVVIPPGYIGFVAKEDLANIDPHHVDGWPNFIWLDISSHKKLWTITPREVRELLYLRHAQRILQPEVVARFRQRVKSKFLFLGRTGEGRIELHCKADEFQNLLRRVLGVKFNAISPKPTALFTPQQMRHMLRPIQTGALYQLQVHERKDPPSFIQYLRVKPTQQTCATWSEILAFAFDEEQRPGWLVFHCPQIRRLAGHQPAIGRRKQPRRNKSRVMKRAK